MYNSAEKLQAPPLPLSQLVSFIYLFKILSILTNIWVNERRRTSFSASRPTFSSSNIKVRAFLLRKVKKKTSEPNFIYIILLLVRVWCSSENQNRIFFSCLMALHILCKYVGYPTSVLWLVTNWTVEFVGILLLRSKIH